MDWLEIVPMSETGLPGPPARTGALALEVKRRPAPLRDPRGLPGTIDLGITEIEGLLRVWAIPEGAKAHPVTGNVLDEIGPVRYGGPRYGNSRVFNPIWDGKSVQLFAARNEIVGFSVVVEPDAERLSGVEVAVSPEFHSAGGAAVDMRPSLFRAWYVRDGDWMPEVAVPLKGTISIPDGDNAVPGQRNQAIAIDLLVPKSIGPGAYTGRVTVKANGRSLFVPVKVSVNGLTLPDKLSFDVSLNAYGTVGHHFGIDDRTPEYRALEREYHRVAHAHRATLAVVGYSHGGRVSTNYAPAVARENGALHVADWSSWDAQFGPYLDGSAFADLPRAGVPVSHFYLPFHEAWPADIRQGYRYNPGTRDYPEMIVEHALSAPRIEQAMDARYRGDFVSVMQDADRHFRERGWTRTDLQFYLNNKNYYKDPKQGGEGTSWWLLDEPNYRDDWLALAYFGRLHREATGGKGPISFREDVSRPEWQRDYLDRLIDLMVVGGAFFQKQPMLRELQRQQGVRYWTYGTANDVRASNLEMEGWAVRAWLFGADGIVPWNSVGGDENYVKPDATALLLPGKRFGITGPVASLRLKALRRAQQDMEYLVLLAKAKGWDRDQVAASLAVASKLASTFRQSSADDAGALRFDALGPDDFNAMRRAIAAASR
jgi:hypothetical protein